MSAASGASGAGGVSGASEQATGAGGVSQNSEASPAASATPQPTNIETGAGAAAEVETPSTPQASPSDLLAALEAIRERVLPILESVRREYAPRVQGGYPTVIDNVRRGGIFGISFAPSFGVYFMTDGQKLYAERHTVALRTDTLSAANSEKFGGHPDIIQREIDNTWTDLHFRNFVSELLSKWNFQQTRIFRVDS
jgi:hypothetical protein